jgi:hypothetical protein
VRRNEAITGSTHAGESLNGSPAMSEASSTTQTPSSGDEWLPAASVTGSLTSSSLTPFIPVLPVTQ